MHLLFQWALAVVNHRWFSNTILALILVNAILVGIETYPGVFSDYSTWFYLADRILLWAFTLEIMIRLFASKPSYCFFQNSWNLFDFIIVASGHLFVGAHFVTVLRILRVLRVLRAISVMPSLRKIVNALLLTIPALGNISLLLGLLFYIFAVIGTMLFSQASPEYFGSLHLSLLTLFQVVTLEAWASDVMRPLVDLVPWAWVYFLVFIMVGTFVIFNLFVGVIVNNVEKAEDQEKETAEKKGTKPPNRTESELAELRKEISELKSLIVSMKKSDRS
jgi:voltage-gated sodium channel